MAHEAIRLFFELIGGLHAVAANREGVLFALVASPQLADALAVFGARYEDDEDDGRGEDDARLSPKVIEDLLAPVALQGGPVAAWAPPDLELPKAPAADLVRYWPGLVRPPADAA